MSADMREMLHFHLTGKRGSSQIDDGLQENSCPALLAPFRQLTKLRYDYPLILLEESTTPAIVDTLSGVIGRLLNEIAPEGNAGARLRQQVLRLETRMRELVADGCESSLVDLWEQAEQSLLAECKKPDAELLRNSLGSARFALRTNGRVVDCTNQLPARLLQHAWAKVEDQRTKKSREQINALIIGLRNILKVDELKSARSRTPQQLKQSLGRRYKEAFDFALMSELLENATPQNRLPADRQRRLKSALAVLESQQFFAATDGEKSRQDSGKYQFVFDNATSALKAYDERLPEIANVIKAISIAELECENAYRESKHGPYFDRFGVQALAPADLALFPAYLICLRDDECGPRDMATLMEIASSDLPMKVLLQVGDALGEPSSASRQPHHGGFMLQAANTFVAAGTAYVLQSTSSNLYRCRAEIRKGLDFAGPAIFSIYAGRDELSPGLPTYLATAAAMESRVFPTFSYDPAAGPGLAERFDISGNPEVDAAWPRRELSYEDETLQMIREDQAFTLVDFATLDPRYSGHFCAAAKDDWNDSMLTVSDYLDLADEDSFEKIPYVPVVDADNRLRRLVVDDQLIRIARLCRDRWHVLQEQGGINNSYASASLLKERVSWEAEKKQQIEAVRAEFAKTGHSQAVEEVTAPPAEENVEAVAAPVEEAAATVSDEAYIETPRCTTCDECTNKNDRMFAYDDNRQAYIKDPDAGTYRELVEAAEACQVSIIHPGKPRNASEAGLDELIKRAEPFMA